MSTSAVKAVYHTANNLKTAKELLLSNGQSIVRGDALARNSSRHPCSPLSDAAVRFSLIGAVQCAAAPDEPVEELRLLQRAYEQRFLGQPVINSVGVWARSVHVSTNDIIGVLNLAISLAEQS